MADVRGGRCNPYAVLGRAPRPCELGSDANVESNACKDALCEADRVSTRRQLAQTQMSDSSWKRADHRLTEPSLLLVGPQRLATLPSEKNPGNGAHRRPGAGAAAAHGLRFGPVARARFDGHVVV